jgi:hypothetical protein
MVYRQFGHLGKSEAPRLYLDITGESWNKRREVARKFRDLSAVEQVWSLAEGS